MPRPNALSHSLTRQWIWKAEFEEQLARLHSSFHTLQRLHTPAHVWFPGVNWAAFLFHLWALFNRHHDQLGGQGNLESASTSTYGIPKALGSSFRRTALSGSCSCAADGSSVCGEKCCDQSRKDAGCSLRLIARFSLLSRRAVVTLSSSGGPPPPPRPTWSDTERSPKR